MRSVRRSIKNLWPAAVVSIAIAMASNLRADDKELLKPADQTRPASVQQVTYKLSNGSENWDAGIRDRIVKAMDEAVAIYNKNGDFNKVLTANWNPGTPTADANFGGWINFGGQIGTRTALHEIAHTLGIGTAPKWRQFARNGIWTGQYGIEQLKQFDGPDAVLHCDNQHFWPYGLNYDNEGGEENFKRNVMMVTAMRADMGLGPPPHPATAAVKAAMADATAAHAAMDKAVNDVSRRETKLKSNLDSRPEVAAAAKAETQARTEYDLAMAAVLKSVHATETYQSAEQTAADARKKVDALRADASTKPDELAAAADAALRSKSKVSRMETEALASDPQVKDASVALKAAEKALEDAKQAAMKNDPELMAAQQAAATARSKALSADQAVVTARQAAVKEQAIQAAAKPQ